MAAASLLPLLPIKIHRHASFNKSNLFCSFKSSHTLHSRLSTVSRICSSSHVGLDSGEEELDNSSIPSTESRWKSIGKRKVAMRVGYVGTNYRGLQIQRDSGSIMTIEDELEKAILKVGGMLDSNYGDLHKIGWRRSSRTDKGVHSLATVIAVKMEIPDGAWEEDPDGIAFADVINRHLPNNIRIFSILPVNKRFDARMECISRKYVYLLPAEVIGIENDSSTEEVECHVKEFRAILQMFQGRHPFHNYTVRAQYRKSAPKAHVNISRPNSLIDNCSKLESQEDKGKHKIPTSDNISSMLKNENLDLQDVSDVEDPLMSLGENTEYGPNASDALKVSVQPRARWLHEPDEVDRISSAHFRKIHSCTCGGLETIASAQYIEIRMHGESFMVHQIRKMVGTAVAVKRALMPQDLITISLSRFSRVVLPIAPSEVLILSSCEFSFPKELHSHGTKFEYSRLTASTKILGRVNDFYSTVLLPEVVDFLDPSKPLWKVWLENLDKSSGIPDAEMKELRDSWTQWKNVVFVENRVDTENDDSEILQTRQ